jgi:2-polyprenyl-6-methoxyphenol hydroxylase-like FAD-dependent oxidoreductase
MAGLARPLLFVEESLAMTAAALLDGRRQNGPYQTSATAERKGDAMDSVAIRLQARCCIVGGGPAGMMLGLLFSRAGIDTIVLEKHADFLRDFRGDTIHPSTLEAMNDLGFYEEFLALPHEKAYVLTGKIGDVTLPLADFSHLPTRAKFIAFMPQWHFLDFLARKAAAYRGFRLMMRADVVSLIDEDGAIKGVVAQTPEGRLEVRADLTIAADGRHSTARQAAGLVPDEIGAPMDVLWFALSRKEDDPHETFGRVEAGQFLILINRGDHWQCGYVIAKGSLSSLQSEDVTTLQKTLADLAPFTADRVAEIESWDDVKLLTVAVNRLPVWHKQGFLCIGDAAHAMSPVGGVGINIAVQDAIATANLLAAPLLQAGALPETALAKVQEHRQRAVKLTQAGQVFIQNRFISKVLDSKAKVAPPWFMRLFIYFPLLQRLPGRLIGLGVLPERVRSPIAPN